MYDLEMSYKGAVFETNMKRMDSLEKAVDKFCRERGLSNDGHRLFLPGGSKGKGQRLIIKDTPQRGMRDAILDVRL